MKKGLKTKILIGGISALMLSSLAVSAIGTFAWFTLANSAMSYHDAYINPANVNLDIDIKQNGTAQGTLDDLSTGYKGWGGDIAPGDITHTTPTTSSSSSTRVSLAGRLTNVTYDGNNFYTASWNDFGTDIAEFRQYDLSRNRVPTDSNNTNFTQKDIIVFDLVLKNTGSGYMAVFLDYRSSLTPKDSTDINDVSASRAERILIRGKSGEDTGYNVNVSGTQYTWEERTHNITYWVPNPTTLNGSVYQDGDDVNETTLNPEASLMFRSTADCNAAAVGSHLNLWKDQTTGGSDSRVSADTTNAYLNANYKLGDATCTHSPNNVNIWTDPTQAAIENDTDYAPAITDVTWEGTFPESIDVENPSPGQRICIIPDASTAGSVDANSDGDYDDPGDTYNHKQTITVFWFLEGIDQDCREEVKDGQTVLNLTFNAIPITLEDD